MSSTKNSKAPEHSVNMSQFCFSFFLKKKKKRDKHGPLKLSSGW